MERTVRKNRRYENGRKEIQMLQFADLEKYYRGKRVLLTGHTGFKGSWLSEMLLLLGAEVYGYALAPEEESLFRILELPVRMHHCEGDIRDFDKLSSFMRETEPEVVLHLAAQPLVRLSYEEPRATFETNVMGTVNLLEALRREGKVQSFLNVTTDKVYENPEQQKHSFREDEKLDGFDPYSNSKSCSELVTHSYQHSFFSGDIPDRTVISTARAGNVIGGGDFARDRIVPDCFRAARAGETIFVRNPFSTRPYQHVLEPLYVYLMIAAVQGGLQADGSLDRRRGQTYASSYNVGPETGDTLTTGELAELFVKNWGEGVHWESRSEKGAVHEANFLSLDTGKCRRSFGWHPVWEARQAVRETVRWYQAYARGQEMRKLTDRQIREFFAEIQSCSRG